MNSIGSWVERRGIEIVAALALIDIVTLIVTVLIALNQGAALDEAIARGCHNSGVLIQKTKAEIKQASPELYRQFFPDVSPAQLKAIISQQREQDRNEIHRLSKGCTPEQLQLRDPA